MTRLRALGLVLTLSVGCIGNLIENPQGIPTCSQLLAADAAWWAHVETGQATPDEWDHYMTAVATIRCIPDAT